MEAGRQLLRFNMPAAISMQASQPKTIMVSKGNGLAILMPRCGIDPKPAERLSK